MHYDNEGKGGDVCMRKIRHIRFKKQKIILLCFLCIAIIGYSVHAFNHFTEPQLQALAKQHVGFAINNIVKEVLSHTKFDHDDLVQVHKSGDSITSVDYNSYKLGQILYAALSTIDASLLAAEDGKKDPTTKNVFYEDGVVYKVPAGYFTHIFFLYDKGPTLHIKMKMLNNVTGEIKTKQEPYGINSTMVTISLVIRIDAQVLTFLSTTPLTTKCEIPVVIQVINGKVPNYVPYSIPSKNNTNEKKTAP